MNKMKIKHALSQAIGIFLKAEYLVLFIMFLKLVYFRKAVGFEVFTSTSFFANMGLILFWAGFILLFKRKFKLWLVIISDVLLTLILFTDLIYFRYSMDLVSIPLLLQVSQLGEVKDSVIQLIRQRDILWFLDFPVIFFVVRKSWHEIRDNNSIRLRIVQVFALLLLGSLSYSYAYMELQKINPVILEMAWSRREVAQNIGVMSFHVVDIGEYLSTNYINKTPLASTGKDAIANWFISHDNGKKNSRFSGVARDRNIIVIQVEALANFVINRKINGKEITPNLNRLTQSGVYFNNFYSQTLGGSTSDAEFMTNVSLYPAKRGAAFNRFSSNEFDSISKILRKNGYKSYVFHGFDPTFWNREIMYASLGYEDFIEQKDFKIDETVGLGLSDRSFFRQSFEKIKNLKEPYYLSLITLSSHYPYNFNDNYGDFDIKGYEDTLLGNYFRAIHYTDQAIGEFISMLNKNGILDRSVLVVYGDHGAVPAYESKLLYDYMGWEDQGAPTWVQTKKVPLIIRFPHEHTKGTNETLGGQIDIKPTIQNLLGIQDGISMGQDLFNKKSDMLIFPNSEFIKQNKLYANGDWYEMKTQQKIADRDIGNYADNCRETLEISRQILLHDCIKDISSQLSARQIQHITMK